MSTRLKETDYLLSWFLFALCGTIGGMVAGGVMGGVIGFVLGALGFNLGLIKILCMVAGFIVGLPISYLCFRVFVKKFIVEKLESLIDAERGISSVQE